MGTEPLRSFLTGPKLNAARATSVLKKVSKKISPIKKIIKTTIKTCLIEHLEDDQAREYLTGKMDNLNKLEKTRDNLKKNNNDEVSEITSPTITTLEDEINRLSDELP